MRLSEYDFTIAHRSGKTNSANALLRRSNYKNSNIFVNRLLSTLQQKLTRIKDLNSSIFATIRAIYATRIKDEVNTTSIYSVSVNTKKCLTIYAECILSKIINTAMQEAHLNVVYLSRRRNS